VSEGAEQVPLRPPPLEAELALVGDGLVAEGLLGLLVPPVLLDDDDAASAGGLEAEGALVLRGGAEVDPCLGEGGIRRRRRPA
jgi:hypothetical protein